MVTERGEVLGDLAAARSSASSAQEEAWAAVCRAWEAWAAVASAPWQPPLRINERILAALECSFWDPKENA